MKKLLLLALWALLPISMSAQSIYTDENGMKWIKDGSANEYYILISESGSVTISGNAWKASDFIPDANFRAFIRTKLGTGNASGTRVYRASKTGYKTFASITGNIDNPGTSTAKPNFQYTKGLEIPANTGIKDFTGIGYFHAAKVVEIKPQGITGTFDLDVTKNASLVYLQVIDTEMKELNTSGLPNLTWLDLAPSTWAKSPDTKLEIVRIENCPNLRGSALYYGQGNEGLDTLTRGERNDNRLFLTNSAADRYCHIKKIFAKNSPKIKRLYCVFSLLNELDVTNCTGLQQIAASYGLLTSDKIYLHGCTNLRTVDLKRQKISSLDFLLKPSTRDGVERTATDIAKLFNLQLNGGSHIVQPSKFGDNSAIRGFRKDESGNPIVTTTAIREFDDTYLDPAVLRTLYVANNLLTKLNLRDDIRANLRQFECDGNFIPTVDLAGYNNRGKNNEETDTIQKINATYQYAYVNAEVVKGAAEDGSEDWVAVHYDDNDSFYSMKFRDGLKIYENRWRSEMDSDNDLRHEKNAWFCTIAETQIEPAASTFNSVMTCPEGSNKRHVFLLSKTELGDKDLDLNGRAITYQHNTRYNQDIDAETQKPVLNTDSTLKLKNEYIVTRTNDSIETNKSALVDVRMQTHSYILNINPKTKVGSGVDYYSGTLFLDYDALIPDGVTVYFISADSVQTQNVIYENGEKIIEQQFKMVPFGGDGETNKILPAFTPVYVKAKTKAGLYAFKPITELNFRGWEQMRGDQVEHTMNILHGVEPSDLRVKEEYVTALANAITLKESKTNLLRGYMGEKYIDYPEFYEQADSTHKEFYNIDKKTVMEGITPRTILTLGREARSGKIGFWPYGGTTLPAHRCYITSNDFMEAGGLPVSSGAKGGASFLFDFNEATGIQVVERNEPKAVAEDEWYTLQGVKLSGRPSRRGVYIHNGKKEQIQ